MRLYSPLAFAVHNARNHATLYTPSMPDQTIPKQLTSGPGNDPRPNPERDRLIADLKREKNWKRWGPYLAERQWGTVREDYSADGSCWSYFPHEHARSRAYRWGEDGLLGITDRECRLCFGLALWNGRDPILKERLFGLTGPEGNHGEDVKEQYFYLNSTPTHSYMRASYKYPVREFPYALLTSENRARTREQPEFELEDTGIFDHGHWDVMIEYAKNTPDDMLVRVSITNRSPNVETIHVLPQAWFRNTWVWGCNHEGCWIKPHMELVAEPSPTAESEVATDHESLGKVRILYGRASDGAKPTMLFTDNHTNTERCFGVPNQTSFLKDAFHDRVIHGKQSAVNPRQMGSKCAGWYTLTIAPGESMTIPCRIVQVAPAGAIQSYPIRAMGLSAFDAMFERTFADRIGEMQRFYSTGRLGTLNAEERNVALQAYAGLLWSKQFYHFIVADWLDGDRDQPPPPPERKRTGVGGARNTEWRHMYARDVILMPDKWEYPWFAAWDLAFHCVAVSHIDPHLAQQQLLLMMREWYMHPSGAIPAYEFAFGDVNPPVHAWACWRVYQITGSRGASGPGQRNRDFLARAFHKLLLNFTWWINRKDPEGRNIFGGGFLGLDNIGVFDRSQKLPGDHTLEQADGTAWMAFFCGTMLSMALELAREDPAYEDVASKFFEHFIAIVDAMNGFQAEGLWDELDGFYYDHLRVGDGAGESVPLRVRSMVGIIPLLAAEVLEENLIAQLPGFQKRMNWFLEHRTDLAKHVSFMSTTDGHEHALLAIPSRDRLERVLKYVLDENEFLSPFGLRSLSKVHQAKPFVLATPDGQRHVVDYQPGESTTSMFGGNSNWRGPVWMPLNYLLIEALDRYHHFYGERFTIACTLGGKKRELSLAEIARELRRRLCSIVLPGADGHRPCFGVHETGDTRSAPARVMTERFATDPAWKGLVNFHEYFHGETGRGLGASHQTGWSALVAQMLKEMSLKGQAKS